MRFEERELKSYAEPVTPNLLTEGEAYFSIQFADEDMLIPIMETWVIAGRKLDPADAVGHLYFQDLESYRQGIRYDSATAQNAQFQLATEKWCINQKLRTLKRPQMQSEIKVGQRFKFNISSDNPSEERTAVNSCAL